MTHQIGCSPQGKMSHKIDLLGHGTPVTIITHDDIQQRFPLQISTFKTMNALTKNILQNLGQFSYDKIAISVHSDDEKYPTKLRTMMGEGPHLSGVRTFGANAKNPLRGHRRSNNLFCLYDNITGDLVSIMSGDAISDFRTACSAAVGVEAIGVPEGAYSVSVLGTGAVGTAVVFALAALRTPPTTIRLVAARKCGYSSVRERLHQHIEQTFAELLDQNMQFIPCDTLKEALDRDTDVVVDAMALPHYQEIVNESVLSLKGRPRFIYVDTNKQALAASLITQFQSHVFDSVKLARRLESPVGSTLKGRLDSPNILSICSLLSGEVEAKPLSTCTIIGVPLVDTKIGSEIYTALCGPAGLGDGDQAPS